MMAPWQMLDIAARRGMLPRTQALSLGARKLSRLIKMRMRFASVRCITFALTPINRPRLATGRYNFSRLAGPWSLQSRGLQRAQRRHRPLHPGLLRHRDRIRRQGLVQHHYRAPSSVPGAPEQKSKELVRNLFLIVSSASEQNYKVIILMHTLTDKYR